jgi:hypothetical protein
MSKSSLNPFAGLTPIGEYFLTHRVAFGVVSQETIEAVLEPLELSRNPKNFSNMLELLKGESDKMELEEFKKHIVSVDKSFAENLGIFRERQAAMNAALFQKDAGYIFYGFSKQLSSIFAGQDAWKLLATFAADGLQLDFTDQDVQRVLFDFDRICNRKNTENNEKNKTLLNRYIWDALVKDKPIKAVFEAIVIWSKANRLQGWIYKKIKNLFFKARIEWLIDDVNSRFKGKGTITIPHEGRMAAIRKELEQTNNYQELGLPKPKFDISNKPGFIPAPVEKKTTPTVGTIIHRNREAFQDIWVSFQDWSSFLIVGLGMSFKESYNTLENFDDVDANFTYQPWIKKIKKEEPGVLIEALARWILYKNEDYILSPKLGPLQDALAPARIYHLLQKKLQKMKVPSTSSIQRQALKCQNFEEFYDATHVDNHD